MEAKFIKIVLGMMLVTYIPRMLPLVVLARVNIPQIIMDWLKYIPVAVLAALLAPELMVVNGNISFINAGVVAAVPCFIVAFRTKNLFYTVFVGMGMMIFLNNFF